MTILVSHFDFRKGRQQPLLSIAKKRDRFYMSGQTPTLTGAGVATNGDSSRAGFGKRWLVHDFGLR